MALIFTIYLLSGVIKTVLIYYGIQLPIDLTLASAVLLLLLILVDFYNNFRKILNVRNVIPLLSLFLFFLWILISSFYSKSDSYLYKKILFFITNIVAFIFPIFIKEFQIKKFLRLFISLIIVSFIWFYYVYFNLINQLSGSEIYYKVMGLSLSLAILGGLVLLILIMSRVKVFNPPVLNHFTIVILTLFLILSGARGPIFFVIILLVFYYSKKFIFLNIPEKINLNRFFKIFLFGLPILAGTIFVVIYKFSDKISVLFERSIYRISLIINGINDSSEMGESVDIRIDQLDFSIDLIFDNIQRFFVGYGFGSFGIMYSGIDGRLYPHNILIEIWFELGIIGLLIFIFFLGSIFFSKIKSRIYITGLVFLYILLNMLKSSSIIDIRIFFAFFALYIIKSNFFEKSHAE